MNNYEDIINLEHHVSSKHQQMPIEKRAAQFAPFSALTGYSDIIEEASRIIYKKVELTEEEKLLLNDKLFNLSRNISNSPKVRIIYFDNDYKVIESTIKKIDVYSKNIVLENKQKIVFDNILDLKITNDGFES